MVPNFSLGIGDPMHWVTNTSLTIVSVYHCSLPAIPLVSNSDQLKTTKNYKGLAWFGADNDSILADAEPMPMPMVTQWHWQCPIVSYHHLDPLVAEWPRLSFDPLTTAFLNQIVERKRKFPWHFENLNDGVFLRTRLVCFNYKKSKYVSRAKLLVR